MADVTLRPMKRGDGFSKICVYKQNGTPTSVEGFDEITGMVRGSNGAKLCDLVVVPDPDQTANPGVFTITADPNPPDWPVDLVRFDLQFTVGGIPRSTQTVYQPVEQDETRP